MHSLRATRLLLLPMRENLQRLRVCIVHAVQAKRKATTLAARFYWSLHRYASDTNAVYSTVTCRQNIILFMNSSGQNDSSGCTSPQTRLTEISAIYTSLSKYYSFSALLGYAFLWINANVQFNTQYYDISCATHSLFNHFQFIAWQLLLTLFWFFFIFLTTLKRNTC